MSDRFDDSGVERVPEPTVEAAPEADQASTPDQGAPAFPMTWAVPLGGQPEPVAAPNPWAPPTHNYTEAAHYTPADPPGPSGRDGERRGRSWFLVAVVAALIGAGVGAGVSAWVNNNSGTTRCV